MQYNFEYTNLSQQRLLGLEVLARWSVLDCLTLNGTYSFVDVSKNKGIQVNTTSPHAATASMDYKYMKKNYRLNAVFSASYMGGKKFDVQDRVFVKEENKSYDAYFRCDLPQYVLCNLSVSQTFGIKVKLTLGMDNLFNYVPKTLGSGITMFNVPATAGARGWVQVEFMLDDVINSLKKEMKHTGLFKTLCFCAGCLLLSACVDYSDIQPFDGKTLPRKSGYTTG